MENVTAYLNAREDIIAYLNERVDVYAYVNLPEGFGGIVLVLGVNNDIVLTLTDDDNVLTIVQ